MKHIEASSDILIVGGGVVGMAIAHYLTRRGDASVTLIDIKKPGNASWASAGGLWPVGESVGLGCGVIFFRTHSKQAQDGVDVDLGGQMPHVLPDHFFDLTLASNALFPSLSTELLESGGVDFKLEETGLLFVIYDDHDLAYSEKIRNAIPHLADQVSWLDADELRRQEPNVTEEAIGALRFSNDHQVNPYLLVRAFRESARQQGARIIEGSEVVDVATHGGKVTGVMTREAFYPCGLMVNAAGSWASQIGRMAGIDVPVYPVKGQIVLSERAPRMIQACLSTSDCYIAQKDNGEILIGSTTEEKGYDVSCSYEKIRDLAAGALRALPELGQLNIKRTWSGLRPGTSDEMPILGPAPGLDGYLNACGHFRTGILTSPITGEIISALVERREPPLPLEPFLLERFESREKAAA